MIRELLTWHDVGERMPDSDRTLLVLLAGESQAWPAWYDRDEGCWYWSEGAQIEGAIKRWAEMPKGEAPL